MSKTYKLAVLTSHPVQYQTPLFRKLAQHPQLDVMVYFCTDSGVTEKVDPGFGVSFKWDVPLLDGYSYKFFRNFSPNFFTGGPFSLINPGIVTELGRQEYDAILIHGYAVVTNWIALLGGFISKTPILFRGETVLRENQYAWKRSLKWIILHLFFRHISGFLPIGTKSKEFYLHYNIPEHRMFLTPYTVDNDFFFKRAETERARVVEIRQEIGIAKGLPIILYASKFTKRKHPFDLLTAFERLSESAALLFVGDGEQRASMEIYAREKKLKNVFFLGFKNQLELPKYYAVADVFVLPSSYEPWGLVINEAMCFGLPIITTDSVAAGVDLVREGRNGFSYPVGEVAKLADILMYLIENPEKRRAMGMNSIEIISSWNYDSCVRGILQALEFVRSEHHPKLYANTAERLK